MSEPSNAEKTASEENLVEEEESNARKSSARRKKKVSTRTPNAALKQTEMEGNTPAAASHDPGAGIAAEPAAVLGKPLVLAPELPPVQEDEANMEDLEVGPGPISCLPGCWFSIIEPGSVGVVQRCGGSYIGYQEPGCIPYCCWIDTINSVDLKVKQVRCHTDCKTLDNVTLKVTTVVTYKINKAKLKQAVFEIDDPENQMQAYADNIIRSALPSMELDQAYANKETLCHSITVELRKSMAQYGYNIYNALVTDLVPDHEVLQAMNAINAAKRKRVAAQEEAEAKKLMQVKEAEAEAEAKYLSGTGIARMRKAIAEGVKESMDTMTAAGISEQDAMRMMITTQYIDTLKDFANNGRSSAIMVPSGPGAASDVEAQVRNGFIAGSALRPQQQEM